MPLVVHAAVQQLPVPLMPQTLLWHMTFAVHVIPAPSLLVHIIDAQYSVPAQSLAVAQPHMPLAVMQIWLLIWLAHPLQAPPPMPHAALVLPVWQLVPSQQPPLQVSGPAQFAEQKLKPFDDTLPGLQALFVPQSACVLQPHCVPLKHWWPADAALQFAHALPSEPHRPTAVPATQVLLPPTSQQPPLQVKPPAHEVVHTCEPLHAWPTGQSLDELQPHTCDARQTWPLDAVEQSTQAMPDVPHAPSAVPAAQVPLLQQAPLHGELFEQAVVHRCVDVLQALPAGQSLAELQPHAPPPVTAVHTWPMLEVEQSTQAPPVEPQPPELLVPGEQLPARQQPPLHGADDEQVDLQVCVEGSHAVIAGQSLAVEQPHAPERQVWPLELVVQSTHEAPQQVGSWLFKSGICRSLPMAKSGCCIRSGPVPLSQQRSS